MLKIALALDPSAIDSRRVIFWEHRQTLARPLLGVRFAFSSLLPSLVFIARRRSDDFQCGASTLINCVVESRDWTGAALTRVLTDFSTFCLQEVPRLLKMLELHILLLYA